MISKDRFNMTLNFENESSELTISSKRENTLYLHLETDGDYESAHQLIEGSSYDYEFSNKEYSFKKNQIANPHSLKVNMGVISTNTFVGTLVLLVYKNEIEIGKVAFEVQSIKSNYRSDYREMLSYIAEKATELIMHSSSPNIQYVEVNYEADSETLYQKFQFIKSFIDTEDFVQSINKIMDSPVTKWSERKEYIDINKLRKLTSSNIREIISSPVRTKIPKDHILNNFNINSLPQRISYKKKKSILDTPENQFVKYALEEYLEFCSIINYKAKKNSLLFNESFILINKLETLLNHSFFEEVSDVRVLHFNSPSLQRKEGYREMFQSWLKFELASKLIWNGGNDVYSSGKKNVSTLYEYWLFFVLLEILEEVADINERDTSDLIEKTKDGLNLKIKRGSLTTISGVYAKEEKKLKIKLNYNRTFTGYKKPNEQGSWSVTMRPDYTISFWPNNLSEKEAEKDNNIRYIHFDAKYKISNLGELIDSYKFSDDKDEDDLEDKPSGEYKNEDLLKMHAYKDAIRGTVGSYVLYPGERAIHFKEFYKSNIGIGALPVRPSNVNSGVNELKEFICNFINDFI